MSIEVGVKVFCDGDEPDEPDNYLHCSKYLIKNSGLQETNVVSDVSQDIVDELTARINLEGWEASYGKIYCPSCKVKPR